MTVRPIWISRIYTLRCADDETLDVAIQALTDERIARKRRAAAPTIPNPEASESPLGRSSSSPRTTSP